MRVLWVCNIMPPMVGKALGLDYSIKEGWITGILEEMIVREENLELGIAYPVEEIKREEGFEILLTAPEVKRGLKEEFGNSRISYETERRKERKSPSVLPVTGKIKKITCYEFLEDTARPEIYGGKELEDRIENIIQQFQPDILHLFGTEYGHSLAAVKKFQKKNRVLVGLQGIVTECATHYMADLPLNIQRQKTFRDILRQDTMKQQQGKFFLRGERENSILEIAGCATGRTEFDQEASRKINPSLTYYSMDETMRREFYEGEWKLEKCKPYQIFFSQADYPLKGFHHMVQAALILKKKFPALTIHVAGNSITGYKTLKEKIKISAYGNYLRKIIRQAKLEDKITFLGRLSAEEMKKEYLACHCYVCASSIENSPNSVAEAMLLGTPVVAARTGGIPSMIEEEQEGLLFEPGNSGELAAGIERIWENASLAKALSRQERRRAHKVHDPKKNYNRLIEIYQQMLS